MTLQSWLSEVIAYWRGRYKDEPITASPAEVLECYKRGETPFEAMESIRVYVVASRLAKHAAPVQLAAQEEQEAPPQAIDIHVRSPYIDEMVLASIDSDKAILTVANAVHTLGLPEFEVLVERKKEA